MFVRRDAEARLFTNNGLIVGACLLGAPLGASSGLHAQALRLEPIATATADQLDGIKSVAAVATDQNGRVFMLDSAGGRIVVTDASLRLLLSSRQAGDAPGENFREPVSIAPLGRARIAVLDKALRRVTVFTVRDAGRSLVVYRTIPLPSAAESMCAVNDSVLLLYGLTQGKRIHLISLEGRPLRAFAPGHARLSAMAQDLLTRGKIGCDPQTDEVVVSSDFLPVVEAFRISTGELAWSDSLKPFRAVALRDQGGRVSISSGRGGFSLISSLFTTAEHRVFQTRFQSRLDHASIDTVVTYVYSKPAHAWRPLRFDIPVLFPLSRGKVLSVEMSGGLAIIKLGRLTIR